MFAVRQLRKAYGGVQALRGVDLSIEAGEIHALLGPNGAGKSTLIKCLGGAVSPDSGEIVVDDQNYDSLTPRSSREAGIAVIYQSFSLVPALTIADNIFLGEENRRGPFVRARAQAAEAKALLERFEIDVDPNSVLADLPIATQQLVEIAKALHHDPRLLILDEPTSSLTEVEARILAEHLRTLKDEGVPILYVTHLLHEVFDVADRVTVLRDGEVALAAQVADLAPDDLVRAIAGDTATTIVREDGRVTEDRVPLIQGVELLGLGIGPIDIDLRAGEVLGVFGLLGSGRTELLECLFGVRKLEGGEVRLDGERVRFKTSADAISEGVALVPGDRLRLSLLQPLPALDNVLLPSFLELAWGGFRRRGRERQAFFDSAKRLQLQPPDPTIKARQLSGGNQQKLAVGRWLGASRPVRVLLLDEPTQGIDVGARADLYRIVRDVVSGGERGVIVTSSEPDEMVAIADRVLVLYRGRLVGELRGKEITEETLLDLAHRTSDVVAE